MNQKIFPGKPWLDTNGDRIEAHGGTMFQENGVYYWLGEDKSHTSKRGKIWTWGIKLYSSTDLYNWKDEGHIISPDTENKESLFYPTRRLDRPHLLKNPNTGKYVLWVKYCDKAHYTVLTADNLLGPYQVVTPFIQPYGCKSGDFDLALDTESGTAYLYFEVNHDQMLCAMLNREFTNVEGDPAVVYGSRKPPLTREGPAHFVRNGKHYLMTSGMIGYVPNPSEIAVSDSWMGPYTVLGNPCVDDPSSATFNSQASCIFQVAETDQFVMMADRWVPDYVMTDDRYQSFYRVIYCREDKSLKPSLKDMGRMIHAPIMGAADTSKANYVWLPFDWDDDMPKLLWRDSWTINDSMESGH